MSDQTGHTPTVELRVRSDLSADERTEILRIVQVATQIDGHPPLSEQSLLELTKTGNDATHLLATEGGRIVGYALRTLSPSLSKTSDDLAEMVVAPQSRGQGIGQRMLTTLVNMPERPHLTLWAHGRDADVRRWAGHLGFEPVRQLLQLRRRLQDLARIELPDGTQLRCLRPGQDDAQLLAINRAAFAQLPDQASWTAQDLQDRFHQPWFDANRCLVAVAGPQAQTPGALLGFHLTKVEPAEPTLGEIYVLAVAPAQAGRGLGHSLALAGMHLLRDAGCTVVRLYVDANNGPAVALYRSLGFQQWDEDVLFRQPEVKPPADRL